MRAEPIIQVIFLQVVLDYPLAQSATFTFSSLGVVNPLPKRSCPGFFGVFHATGRAAAIRVDIGTHDGDAENAVLQQAQIAFCLVEWYLCQRCDGDVEV